MLDSKPTSMPPSPLSSTMGNFEITTISGMASSSIPDMFTPLAARLTAAEATSSTPATKTPRSNQRLRDGVSAAGGGAMGPPDRNEEHQYQPTGRRVWVF